MPRVYSAEALSGGVEISPAARSPDREPVKCVLWDLDGTLWHGVLAEGDEVRVRAMVPDILTGLDERGVLNSIISRNDHEQVMSVLRAEGLAHYFVVPQVDWGVKSAAVSRVSEALGISPSNMVFIDDDPFECEQVASVHAALRTLGPAELPTLLTLPGIAGLPRTDEAAARRPRYQQEMDRIAAESSFVGPSEAFLASLNLQMTLRPATVEDLDRAAELTERTNQLNSTGRECPAAELKALIDSDRHAVLIVELRDRFGDYGRIGVAVIERTVERPGTWCIQLLLMSCRVISRGVGGLLLTSILRASRRAGVALQAEFKDTGRNRAMNLCLRLAGFEDGPKPTDYDPGSNDIRLLEHTGEVLPEWPDYVALSEPEGEDSALMRAFRGGGR